MRERKKPDPNIMIKFWYPWLRQAHSQADFIQPNFYTWYIFLGSFRVEITSITWFYFKT